MNIICPACLTHYAVDLRFPEQGRKARCAKCGEVWHAVAQGPVSVAPAPASGRSWGTVAGVARDAGESPDAEAGADFHAPSDGSMPEPMPQVEPAPDIAWMQALAEEDARARRARLVDDEDDSKPASGRRVTIRRRRSMSTARIAQAFVVGMTIAGLAAAFTHKEDIVALAPSTARLYALAGIEVNIRGLAFENLKFAQENESGVPVLSLSGDIVNVAGRNVEVPLIRLSLAGRNTPELYSWTIEPTLTSLGPGESLPFTARLAAPPRDAASVSVRFVDNPPTRLGLAR